MDGWMDGWMGWMDGLGDEGRTDFGRKREREKG